MARTKKRVKRHLFTDAQVAELKGLEKAYGATRNTAKMALKQAAFRYPGAPRRTVGSIANKLWKLGLDRQKGIVTKVPQVKTVSVEKQSAPEQPQKKLHFSGHIVGDMLELNMWVNISNLKDLI